MNAATRFSAAFAGRAYRTLLRLHPASNAGYAAQMAATFDALLVSAAHAGIRAVVVLFVREAAGLLVTTRRQASLPSRRPQPQRVPLMETVRQDLRHAWRNFRRRPGVTAALVATLALGIGANTAIFSVVNAVLLQRLPFEDPGRLVMVWEDASKAGFPRNTPAPGNYADWTTSIDALADVAALSQRDFNLVGDGAPERVGGASATANLFSVLGVQPVLGRTWRADEDVPGNRIAVVSYGLWQRRFNGDPGILDQTVLFDGNPYRVIGVMPPRFQVISPEIQIWVPIGFNAERLSNRGAHYLEVVGRLAPTATLAQANAQLAALAQRLQLEHPDTNADIGMYAVPVLEDYLGDTRAVLFMLLAAVACVLLVACVNVANLLLTGAMARAREMAVRAALGADRRRLVRQLLTESLLLSVLGGVLGIAVALASFDTLTLLVPPALADLSRVGLDGRVLAVAGLVTIVTGLLFGAAPAWRASRVDFAAAGGRMSARGAVSGPARLSKALVVAEIALATVVLVGAGLFMTSFASISAVDLGFNPKNVLTARVQLPRPAFTEFEKRKAFVDAVLERVRAIPGVDSAGYTSAVPLTWKGGTSGFVPEGRAVDRSLSYDANNRVVSPGYMETIGMTLRAGRFFSAQDDANGVQVAIINRRMAEQYWPSEDPVGRRFTSGAEGESPAVRTIVGVVDDTRVMGIDQPTKAEMYFPLAQSQNNWMWPRDLVVRFSGSTAGMADALRQAVWSVDPSQPVSRVQLLSDIVDSELQGRWLLMTLMAVFAGLALALAAVGVFGVLSYVVTSRTKEIGLRLALGGEPSRIRRGVVAQGMTLAVVGLAIGTSLAVLGASLVDRLLFQVSPHDPRTFAIQAVILLATCFVASYLPALRASRVDPNTALGES